MINVSLKIFEVPSVEKKGKKGFQKILSFLPLYLFSFKKLVTAVSIKCVRLRYLIPSANLSTSFIKSVGNRIVTVVVSLFDITERIKQLNINICKQILAFVIQINANGMECDLNGAKF